MDNRNKLAFPSSDGLNDNIGMTKREYAAIKAMESILAAWHYSINSGECPFLLS